MAASRSHDPSAKDVKILLIGNSQVGKTTLLLRFLDSDESLNANTAVTVGMDFHLHAMKVGGRMVRLSIWDTAGQERFRSLTNNFFRGAQGVVLVYDVCDRGSFEALRQWYADVETRAPAETVKVLVANKVDKTEGRQVSKDEGAAYARQMDSLYVEASAKTAEGVKEVFEKLAKRILEMEGANRTALVSHNSAVRASSTARSPGSASASNSSDRARAVGRTLIRVQAQGGGYTDGRPPSAGCGC